MATTVPPSPERFPSLPALLLVFSALLLFAFPHHLLLLFRSLITRLLNGLVFLFYTSLAIVAFRIIVSRSHGPHGARREDEASPSPSQEGYAGDGYGSRFVAERRRRRESGNVMLDRSVCETAELETDGGGGGAWKERRYEGGEEEKPLREDGKPGKGQEESAVKDQEDPDPDQEVEEEDEEAEAEEEKALEEALVKEVEKQQRKGETAEMRAAMMALMSSRELGRQADAFISKFFKGSDP